MRAARNGNRRSIGPIGGVMFDLDGTLVLTDKGLGTYQVLPGAIEVLTELNARGIPFVALTNGSAYPVAQQAPKLRALMAQIICLVTGSEVRSRPIAVIPTVPPL